MDAHTLEAVAFSRIAQMIAQYCTCEEAQQLCLQKEPLTDPAAIAAAKKQGADFLQLLQKDNAPRIQGRPPLFPILPQLRITGTCLSLEEIYAIGLLAEQVQKLQQWAGRQKQHTDTIVGCIAALPDLAKVHSAVFAFIDPQGSLRDIPSLRALQRRIRQIEADMEKTMHRYCTDEATRSMLQNPQPVLRNGRQVIAVRSNFKGRIKGIIHEYSQSGQSFYLEPEQMVLKNNELVKAQAAYDQELRKLLRGLSAELAQNSAQLEHAHQNLLALECTAAAARWAQANQAVFANDAGDSQTFYLHQARHPLLGSQAVPIDIKLSDSERILIITGANTGGKTVALKTAALFVLLNQTGWPIPAASDSCLPFFDAVFCAIGDEQSLDTSLSTFSAYMRIIAGILSAATSRSLIILDELGNGTDPQEGGALAMAVLDELLSRRARVLVTTHHGALKQYAYSKDGCVNASVVFDKDTLRPSYHLVMGIPGESHAIDIAEQSGIQAAIIKSARAYLSNNSADVATLIQGLIEKHERLRLFEQEREAAENKLADQKQKYEQQALALRRKEAALRTEGYKRLQDLFETKRAEAENLVRLIREGALTHEKTGSLKQFFSAFEQQLAEEQAGLQQEEHALTALQYTHRISQPAGAALPLQAGAEVFIPHLRRRGTVVRKEKERWLVAVDTLKMTLNAAQLEVIEQSKGAKQPVLVEAELQQQSRPVLELRLLGMHLAEAAAALEKQLDLALMHNVQEFAVIHGKGNGVLQTMVHEKLEAAPYVADFAFARPEQGGSGKTIVHLR